MEQGKRKKNFLGRFACDFSFLHILSAEWMEGKGRRHAPWRGDDGHGRACGSVRGRDEGA